MIFLILLAGCFSFWRYRYQQSLVVQSCNHSGYDPFVPSASAHNIPEHLISTQGEVRLTFYHYIGLPVLCLILLVGPKLSYIGPIGLWVGLVYIYSNVGIWIIPWYNIIRTILNHRLGDRFRLRVYGHGMGIAVYGSGLAYYNIMLIYVFVNIIFVGPLGLGEITLHGIYHCLLSKCNHKLE